MNEQYFGPSTGQCLQYETPDDKGNAAMMVRYRAWLAKGWPGFAAEQAALIALHAKHHPDTPIPEDCNGVLIRSKHQFYKNPTSPNPETLL